MLQMHRRATGCAEAADFPSESGHPSPQLPSLILELVGGDNMAFELDTVQNDIRTLRRFLKHAPKHAKPQLVHSLRTATRRFEAAMQALALDSNANERRLLRELAKLCTRAGKVRDLDVLTAYVADLKISGEQECLVQLREYLGSEHDHRTLQLHSFAVKHGESLRRRLKRTSSRLEALEKDGAAGNSPPGYTILSELRLQRELAAPIRLTKKNLHPYRLQVKELRYMLEMENDPQDQALIATLGQVKDAIGEWHDWQQLLTIGREHLHHTPKCRLILLFQETTRKKFKHALVVAKAGRQYIQPLRTRNKENP
jgi:CHAD domain-containing protein